MELLSARARKLVAGAVVGGAIGALAAATAWVRPAVVERGELWTYDVRARRAADPAAASPEIVIVDVGEKDLEDVEDQLGLSWPWPRAIWGYLVRYISNAGANAIVLDWIFQDRGCWGASDAEEFAAAMRVSGRTVFGLPLVRLAPDAPPAGGRWAAPLGVFPAGEARRVGLRLLAWHTRVFLAPAADGALAVWLGGEDGPDEVRAAWSRLAGAPDLEDLFAERAEPSPPVELGEEILVGELTAESIVRERDALPLSIPPGLKLPAKAAMDPPLAILAAAAARLGGVFQDNEADGIMRRHAPLAVHDGRVYPSLALAAWLVAHPGASPALDGATLVLGDRRLPLDPDGKLGVRFHRRGRRDPYVHVRAWDVLRSQALVDEGRPPALPPDLFRGKYVFVSATAHALRDLRATPVSPLHLGAEIQANALDNLLSGRVIGRAPAWVDALAAYLLAVGLALGVVALWLAIPSRLAFVAIAGLAGAVVAGYLVAADRLFAARGLWIAVATPTTAATVSTFAALLVVSALERRDRRFVQEALGRYTSDELVRELVAHPERLSLEWGERREMSVFFSDIAGFTSFSEAMVPERLVALLNEYLTEMTEIVLAHRGIVDKYIGDAIMAFWGAPLEAPDHARRAVRCAVEMQRRCEELRPRWRSRYAVDLFARAGITSGVAVAGNMGSRHKYNYTVMGDTVNLASRLEGANKAYGTSLLVGEKTWDEAQEEVDGRELDLLAVKGKERPVRIYEVFALRGAAAPDVTEAARRFADGLFAYRERRFADALARFRAALEARPDDGPSRVYVTRCEHFLATPPPDDWDGVWHMKEK